jgi:DNA-binding transcriptional LysR family regulator
MDLVTQMRVFVRVAEAQSFTGAARQMNLSKSVVSKYIGELEDRLDVLLFHRTTRHLSLTEQGAGYYERCTHILAEIEEAEAAIGALDQEPRGTVRLLLPAGFADPDTFAALADLLRRWPKLSIEIALDDSADVASEAAMDISVRYADSADHPIGEAQFLATVPAVLVAAPSYAQATAAPVAPPDLAFHNCLSLARPRGDAFWHFESTQRGKSTPVRVTGTFQASSLALLRLAALAGIGVTVLPLAMVEEDLAAGRLVRLLVSHPHDDWALIAVRPTTDPAPARVRAVMEALSLLVAADLGRFDRRAGRSAA